MSQVEELGEQPRPPHGGRLAARARARGRARDVRSRRAPSRSPASARGRCRARCSSRERRPDRIWVEAVESHIGGWFWNAAARARACARSPRPSTTSSCRRPRRSRGRSRATVEVQPTPEIVDWTTLEVPRAEAVVPQELVRPGARGTAAARRGARARRRPPRAGGRHARRRPRRPDGEAQSDTVVELGLGRLVEEIESALSARAWARRRTSLRARRRLRAPRSTITVKHVNEKVLPEIDDELARSASEFDTLAELRARHRGSRPRRGRGGDRRRLPGRRGRRRSCAPRTSRRAGPLVETRARELLDGFVRSLGEPRDRRPRPTSRSPASRPSCSSRRCRPRRRSRSRASSRSRRSPSKAGIEVSDDDVKDADPRAGRGVRRRSRRR